MSIFAGLISGSSATIGGNVGIGTSSPSYKLDVNGTSYYADTLYFGAGTNSLISWTAGYSDGTTLIVRGPNAGSMILQPNSAQTGIFISSSGNVGIGTTSPSYKLDVAGTVKSSGSYIHGASGTSGNIIVQSGGSSAFWISTKTDSSFHIGGNGGTEPTGVIIITNTGNVGIGTNAPQYKLHVSGGLSLFNSSTVGSDGNSGIRIVSPIATTHYNWMLGAQQNVNSAFEITPSTAVGGTTFSTPTAVFTATGNVGIGTTSPGAKLHIQGNVSASSFTGSLFGTSSWASNAVTANNGLTGGTTSYIPLWTSATAQSSSAIYQASNNIGIGTTPSYPLHLKSTTTNTGLIHLGIDNVSSAASLPTRLLQGWNGYYNNGSNGHNLFLTSNDFSEISSWEFNFTKTWNGVLTFGVSSDGTQITRHVTINGSGNVGIGTSSPSARLHVSSSAQELSRFQSSNTGGAYTTWYNGSIASLFAGYGATLSSGATNNDGVIRYNGSYNLIFSRDGAEAARFNSSGNFGIGTTIPSASLAVQVAASNYIFDLVNGGETGFKLRTYNHGSVSSNSVVFTKGLYYNTTENASIKFYRGSSDTGGWLTFTTNNGTERVRIDNSGYVGINTTSPSSLLHVYSSTAVPVIRVDTGAGGNNAELKLSYAGSDSHGMTLRYYPSNATAYVDNTYPTSSGQVYGDIYFRQNINGTMTSRMMIQAQTGNVGIGTTSPAAPLHVAGTITNGAPVASGAMLGQANGYGVLQLNGSNGGHIDFSNDTGTDFVGRIINFNSDKSMYFYTNGSVAMVISGSGNVGIGTTSPTTPLYVVGNIQTTTGVIASTFWTNTDIRKLNASTAMNFKDSAGNIEMIIDSSGNVGIGTSTVHDSAKLDVRSGKIVAGTIGSTGGPVILQGYYSNGAITVFGSEYSNGGPVLGYAVKPSTSAAGAFLSSTGITVSRGAYTISGPNHTWYGGGSQTVAIDSSVSMTANMALTTTGLGIGTTSPSAKLVVSDTTNFTNTIFNGTSTGGYVEFHEAGTVRVYLQWGLTIAGSANGNYVLLTNTESGGNIALQTRTSGGTLNTSALVVDSNGNVGLTTSAPSAKLDVSGSSTAHYFGVNPSGLSNTGHGISLYGGAQSTVTYGLMFQGTGTYGTHGPVTGDWATYFMMNPDSTRGWIFKRQGSSNVASISAGGVGSFAGIYSTDTGSANTGRIVNPGGGYYVTSTSTVTGAWKIKLPTAKNNSSTMMRMTVQIYQYSTGTSHTFYIGGYNYAGGNWYNIFATQINDAISSAYTIRFGYDGTSDCIWIGETNSSWAYPQVYVTDVQVGYSGYDPAWATGWEISPVTSFDTVEQSRAASVVWGSNNDGASSGLDADLLDGNHGSYYTTAGNLSGTIPSSVLGNSTVYIGTTAIALNRSSAGQTLTGVNIDGSAASAGIVTGTTGQLLRYDDRIISPSEVTAGYLQFGFTSFANNNTSPYADYLHLRSYTDSSGGNDNLVMFSKSSIAMRIYQQSFGSGTAYSSYADVILSNGSYADPSWITSLAGSKVSGNISGNAANITAYTINQNVGTGNSPSFAGLTIDTNTLYVDATNNRVGIITTSPADTLDVRGNLRVGAGASATTITNGIFVSNTTLADSRGIEFFSNDGTYSPRAFISHTATATSQLLTFNSTYGSGTGYANFIFSNGNVGIGTTSPAGKLSISGGTETHSTAKVIGMTGTGAANNNQYNWAITAESDVNWGFRVSNKSSGQYFTDILGAFSDGNNRGFRVINKADAVETVFMFINSSGNVGIGTTAPSYKLDVNGGVRLADGGSRPTVIETGGMIYSQGDTGGWAFGHHIKGSSGTDRGGFGFYGGVNALTYYYIGQDYLSPTMVIQSGSSGNVGIGTISPGARLHVQGAVSASSYTANGNTVWHAGNDGAGSGLDADLLDGYSSATAATANTIALRDGSGHLSMNYGFASYYNSSDDVSAGTITYIMAKFGDNYFRSATAAKVAAFISGQTMNIAGNATTTSQTNFSSLTVNSNTVWHAGNDGAGSGLDADLLDGYNSATAATGNTIALRNGNGDLTVRYIYINGLTYTWPSGHGSANAVLTNNGSGTLSWSAGSGGPSNQWAYSNVF
jgi:hypothetical protein